MISTNNNHSDIWVLPAGMFEDEEFQLKAPVDQRGRKVKRTKRDEGLRKYYRQEEEVWAHIMHIPAFPRAPCLRIQYP
jgi:hypothetical protein